MNIFKKLLTKDKNLTVREFEEKYDVKLYHRDGRDIRDDCLVKNVKKSQFDYMSRKLKK